MAGNFYLFLDSRNGFFKFQRQVVTQILAATASPRPAATEEFAENIAKDILEAARKVETAAGKRTAVAESGVAKLVVLRALLRIGKYRVGFGNFLETSLPLVYRPDCDPDDTAGLVSGTSS